MSQRVRVSVRLLCWVLREFRKKFLGKRPALFKSGQWNFHKDNAPVHNSILVTDYLTKMGIKTVPHPPYCPDLALCDFGYSLSSEAVVMRQLRRWKRLWRRSLTRSHKRTSMRPSRSCWNGTTSALQPEEITSKGTRVSCVLSIKVPKRSAHLGQIVCDKDGVVVWCIVLLEIPLILFEECWPLLTESLPELP